MDDPDKRLGFYISAINRAAMSYYTKALKSLNLGPGQQAYLLSILPGEVIMQDEMVRRLGVDRANVTRAVQTLVRKGYFKRKKNPVDNRRWMISLTPSGEECRKETEKIAKDWVMRLRGDLARDEWIRGVDFLETVATNLDMESTDSKGQH